MLTARWNLSKPDLAIESEDLTRVKSDGGFLSSGFGKSGLALNTGLPWRDNRSGGAENKITVTSLFKSSCIQCTRFESFLAPFNQNSLSSHSTKMADAYGLLCVDVCFSVCVCVGVVFVCVCFCVYSVCVCVCLYVLVEVGTMRFAKF